MKKNATSFDNTPRSDDTLTIGVAKAMNRDLSQFSEPLGGPLPYDAQLDADTIKGHAIALDYLEQAGVKPTADEPSMLAVWGANFRQNNVVASTLSSNTLAETLFPTRDSPEISTDDLLKRIEADKLSPYQQHFVGVRTVADYEATKADLTRRIEDHKIMAAGGGFNNLAASLAAGVFDLPSLLPGSIGFRLGAAGVNAGRAAVGVAGGAVLGAGAAEVALHATQVGRTWEESATAVGGSIILGGILGGALHVAAYRTLGPGIVRTAEMRLEKAAELLADDAAGLKSAGAAEVSLYEKLRESGINSHKPLKAFGMFSSLEALGKIPGFIGKNARIPLLDLGRSQSPSAVAAMESLAFNIKHTEANVQGMGVKGSPVMAFVRDRREQMVSILEKGDELYAKNRSAFKNADDYDDQITYALIDPTAPAHPVVAEVAKLHREVYTSILDDLIEAKVLPPEVKERYGDTYFPMIFNADTILANPAKFKEMVFNGFSRDFRAEATKALKEQQLRREANEQAKKEIFGVKVKEPVYDERGQPVIAKTGKPQQRTRVIEEGQQGERDRITKEQYELRKEYLEEQRAIEKSVIDAQTKTRIDESEGFFNYQRRGFIQAFESQTAAAIKNETLTAAQRIALVNRITRERDRLIASVEKEHNDRVAKINTEQRQLAKEKIDPINQELEEAKAIMKDNLGHSKEQAKAAYEARKQPLRDGLEDGLRFVRDGKVSEAEINREATNLAQHWYESVTGRNKLTLEHEIPGFAEYLKKRRTPVSHKELADAGFVHKSAHTAFEDYIRAAGTDAAVAKKFKKLVRPKGPDGKVDKESDLIEVGDLRLGAVKSDIRDDYAQLIDRIPESEAYKKGAAKIEKKFEKLASKTENAEEKARLAQQMQDEINFMRGQMEKELNEAAARDWDNIEAVLNAIRGVDPSGSSESFRRAMEVLGTVNYMRLLGGTVISSFTDPFKIAISVGLGNTLRGGMMAYQQTFASGWKNANAVNRGLSRAGAAAVELVHGGRLASMADVANPHRFDSAGVNMMRRGAARFSKLSGIAYWNAFWKQTSENATSMYMGQLAHKGWDNIAKSERAWLDGLRINKDGLEMIKQAHLNQPRDKWWDDWPFLDHESWDDKQAAMLVRHALGEEINNQVITPQAYDRMNFANSTTGRTVWQFRQHMLSNQMRFIGRQVQLASLESERAAGLAAGFTGLVMAGALIDFLKQATGQMSPIGNLDRRKDPIQRQMEEWSKTPGMALYNALDRSDTLGVLMEFSNVLDKTIGFGPKSIMTSFDDKRALKEASRFKNRSVADTLLGPTVGLGNDVIGATRMFGKLGDQAIHGINRHNKLSRGDYRSFERLIPGQNIFWGQWAGNAIERYVGDVYHWPDPK